MRVHSVDLHAVALIRLDGGQPAVNTLMRTRAHPNNPFALDEKAKGREFIL
jgi:hypothetical protein